ncbi:hypothetical protein O0I10_002979 [Lichtheimia ornata]|uniref:Uncharacterized protein n=1 Tax=Lichtheimia ornata TaxID=688661 RepID=A0AAD7VAC7_9FUNG|nr:uncharacterized protein O0I10_002979 [Lichtheimia ornata]KAJ8661230.1 hypothetical protein O0I10_002979 [Lichtheimia ornata]
MKADTIGFKVNGQDSIFDKDKRMLLWRGVSELSLVYRECKCRSRHAIVKKHKTNIDKIQCFFDVSGDQTRIRFVVYLLEFTDADGSVARKAVYSRRHPTWNLWDP